MRTRFLVVYDYGQGGLWGYVLADSPEEITQRFPELQVVAERPDWLDEEYEAKLSADEEDIDAPGPGLLGILLAHPEWDGG